MFNSMKMWTYDMLGINMPTPWDHAEQTAIAAVVLIVTFMVSKWYGWK